VQNVTGTVATVALLLDTNAAAPAEFGTNGLAGGTGLEPDAAGAFTGMVAKIEAPEVVISNRYRQAQIIINDCDAEWVLQRYLNAFAQAYDPHSSYFTPSSMADFEIEMNLSLFGIGALLSSEDGAAKIVRLIPGGPAAHDTRDKRLLPGDKIIAVAQDGAERVDILHWPLNKIVGLIRGEKGTRVVLTVIPASDPSGTLTKTVDLVRDEVKLEDEAAKGTVRTVTDADGRSRKLGIIKLPAFYGNMHVHSPEEPGFRSAVFDVLKILRDLKPQKVDGVLLDLRGNGGGALAEAIDMTGLFIRKGPTVQVKENFGIRPLDDEDPRILYEGPLVVLVNRLSASASEILAGALQDYGRALIVGDSKTHGKGTVQSVVSLGNDETMGSLKITTASYIRITGAATQLHGILPDIVVPSPWDFMETGEEFLLNPVPWSQEQPAIFRRVANLEAVLPNLRERSEARRRQDPDFQTYARFLERIVQMNETKALPLNRETRKHLAETEKELGDLQDRLTAEQGGDAAPDDAASAADLVLKEALAILADFVNVGGAEAARSSAPPAAPARQSASTW
jgi:carboxyl-terminal processing protease